MQADPALAEDAREDSLHARRMHRQQPVDVGRERARHRVGAPGLAREAVVHREDRLDAGRTAADHQQLPERPAARTLAPAVPGAEEPVDGLHPDRVLDRAGDAGGRRRSADVERDEIELERPAVGERHHPPARIDAGRQRFPEARTREAGHALEVDVHRRVVVVAGDESRQHPRVRRQPVRADEHQLDAGQRRAAEPAQHLDVRVAAADEDEALQRARRRTMSPNQAVADAPVSSVSVMTATPAIAGGSSPKARR